jgi:hypothetical protein
MARYDLSTYATLQVARFGPWKHARDRAQIRTTTGQHPWIPLLWNRQPISRDSLSAVRLHGFLRLHGAIKSLHVI